MLAGVGAVLISLDWRLGLVMILPVPLFCWAIYRHGEVLNRVFLRVWRKWSRLTDVLSDTMPGIRVVKAFNQEAREVARFVGHNNDVTDEINRLHALWTTFWPLLMLAVHATDRKSTRLNSSHGSISYAVFCLKKKNTNEQ